MIKYKKEDFLQNGFEYQATLVDGLNSYIFKAKLLSYELTIDDNNNQVSVSGDTHQPFSSESMYEFYVPCSLLVYTSENEINYRYFHFSFYSNTEPSEESLVLTMSCRKSDGELVVWPNFK